ncbi:MAG: 1-deoxy-D-xylulose-5-phosphate synthase N-terminal domain-containing protein, partial [Oscillospiraceae bacterium]
MNVINTPDKIKKASFFQLNMLSKDVRKRLIDVVSNNGGHLASNLGTVEITLALLRCFNPPEDKIVFDVGHQCYTYKLLTDRAN